MWLASKIKQVIMALKPGVVTLPYPFKPSPVPRDFRGQPHWDHHRCVGCGGCADHCPARTILVRDICQELRIMLYDGSRCTYCGRCAELCPEKAIALSEEFELATNSKEDITTSMELFMATCSRCGRCFEHEHSSAINRMSLKGYRYDNLELRAVIPRRSEVLDTTMLDSTVTYRRPRTPGE